MRANIKKVEKYINRYGDEYTFTLQDDDNIRWEGPFEYCRFGFKGDPKITTMIDPSGGPYIAVGTNCDWIIFDMENYKVVGFEKIDTGYLILTGPINKKDEKRDTEC